jgi:hypothetical protein
LPINRKKRNDWHTHVNDTINSRCNGCYNEENGIKRKARDYGPGPSKKEKLRLKREERQR